MYDKIAEGTAVLLLQYVNINAGRTKLFMSQPQNSGQSINPVTCKRQDSPVKKTQPCDSLIIAVLMLPEITVVLNVACYVYAYLCFI